MLGHAKAALSRRREQDDPWGLAYLLENVAANEVDMPRCYGYQMNHNGRVRRYGNNPEDYLTDVLSGLAVDFVERSVGEREPFFLYLAPTAPHLPAIPAPRHQDMFEDIEAPRPPRSTRRIYRTNPLGSWGGR